MLAVYYSQSGQMRRILERVLAPLVAAGVEVVWAPLEPVPAYPFPWPVGEFFDAFPETVAGIPCALRPPSFDPDGQYDLVVLGWQPWFLSPSIPAASFLRGAARQVLAGRPVVTVVGARNMWLVAQEEVKRLVRAAGGRLVGNIALADRAPNLVSAVTILRWMLRGRRGALSRISGGRREHGGRRRRGALRPGAAIPPARRLLRGGAGTAPGAGRRAGQSPADGHRAARDIHFPALVPLHPRPQARTAAGRARRIKVALFSVYLPLVLFLVSPLVSLLAAFGARLHPARTAREVDYHSGVDLRPPGA